MQAVILAGGEGLRLREISGDLPKPLIKINGKSVLEYQIETLKAQGVRDVIIIVGYQGNKIKEYFGDGSGFGVYIRYYEEEEPLGTWGAIPLIQELLEESFLLIYGDIIFDVYLDKLINFHNERDSLCTLVVHPNNHPYDSDIVKLDENHRVTNIYGKNLSRDFYYRNIVNSGLFLIDKSVIDKSIIDKSITDRSITDKSIIDKSNINNIQKGKKQDFEKDLLPQIIGLQRAYGYKTSEYIKDMGTPKRYNEVSESLKQGIVSKRNLKNKQKAVFLDRDGTINKENGLIYDVDQFEMIKMSYDAIKILNDSEYISILITNQSVIARNLCTIEELENIHMKMECLLGDNNSYIDEIYYCPHHPDKGFANENLEYKVNCNCRKPAIGLIQKAVEEFNIDTEQSYFIGDSTSDIMAGKNASLKTILVETGLAGLDGKYNIEPDLRARNILEAVKLIRK